MTKNDQNASTQNIWRWILFVPASVIASEITKYLMGKSGRTIEIFFPQLGQTLSGIISWTAASIVLIFVAYKIIPSHKKATIKIYSIIWTIIIIGWTVFVYFLGQEGYLSGSFWYPLLINIGFLAGIWWTYVYMVKTNNGRHKANKTK